MWRTQMLAAWVLAVVAAGAACAEPANVGALKQEIRAYVENGAYEREVSRVAAAAGGWLEQRVRLQPRVSAGGGTDQRLALVMDLDDTLLRNADHILAHDFGYEPAVWDAWVQAAQAPALEPVRELHRTARRLGLAVVYLTARRERERAASERNLRAVGCGDFERLICRPDDSPLESGAFKRGARERLAADGFVIIANVGDQVSDFVGGGAEREFKLPNPFYFTP